MYATPWHLTDTDSDSAAAAGGELPDYLRLWRFERYYRLSGDQLPHVLSREVLDASTLSFRRWQHPGQLTGARIWLFALPSGQIVAALSLDVHSELTGTIDVLEDCNFTDVHIGQAPVEQYAHTLAARLGAAASPDDQFLPERHQIVFDQAPAADDSEKVIQRLIYRADLPCRKEYGAIRYPAELNRRPGWLAAVGPVRERARRPPGLHPEQHLPVRGPGRRRSRPAARDPARRVR